MIIAIILLMLIVVSSFGAYLLKMGYDTYQIDREKKPVAMMRTAIIEEVADYVEYEDISPAFINSIVAIEDHRFFQREGIDFVSLARALYSTFIKKMPQGGSTITQQLAKNYYYSFVLTLDQKMAEFFFLYEIEKTYSKKEIIEMYLNIIYYGDGYYGISQAAKGYFDKEPSELDLFEGSLLAGVINAPSIYNLSTGKKLAIKRQISVINALYRNGYIDESTQSELLARGEEYAAGE